MLPAIAAGFGMPLIVLWRGYGGATHPQGDVARWRAPDGSASLLYHLSPDGYELGSSLPSSEVGARERWRALRARSRAAGHAGRGAVAEWRGSSCATAGSRACRGALLRAPRSPTRCGSPASATSRSAIVARAARAATIPEVSGELRDSYGYTWTLQGTFATRSALKRRAARAERSLVRNTEPWVALADRARETDRGALMRAAWTHAAPVPAARHAVRLLRGCRRARDGVAARGCRGAIGGAARGRALRSHRIRCGCHTSGA